MKRLVAVVLTLLVVLSIPIFGQTRGSLTGAVTDPAQAAVGGANVTVKNIATGEELRAVTNAQGIFVFPSLAVGQYSVTVEAPGFKRAEAQEVTVEVATQARVSIQLEVGGVTEVVTVSAAQDVINTTSPTLTNVINARQVRDLPLADRNPLNLARLQAGIAVTAFDTRNASVGGLRGTATTVTQDGINAMDNFVKTSSFFAISAPSLESTEEFSVTVGTVGSDAGRGVAQVRMVTKSGTNEFHGKVFWQHRNDVLNANSFFNNAVGTERPRELQNWFGFAVGGPVYLPKIYDGRDRSFWFFSYEGFREPFAVTRNRTVLTPEARQGVFRYIGSNGQLQSVNLLQIGNFNTLNPVTGAQLNAMPPPNNTLVGDGLNTAGFRFNVSGVNNNDRISLRADQKLFDKLGSHRLEWVFHRAEFILTPDTFNGLEAPFPGGVDAEQSSTRTLTAAAIHSSFGAKATNEVRFGHQRAPVGFLRKAPPEAAFFILYNPAGSSTPVTNFNNTFMSQGRNTLVYQFVDNFSIVQGSHTFRAGTDVQSVSAVTFNDAGTHPVINIISNSANPDGILNSEFPNLPTGSTGTGIANRARTVYHEIAGVLGSGNRTFNVVSPTSGFIPGVTRERDFLYRDISLYFQDQWRMRRNFTLNYGVRYEWLGVPTTPNGLAIQPLGGVSGLFGISGAGNLFNPGVLRGTAPTTIDFVSGKSGRPLYGDDWNNFAPFIGIAYSPNFTAGPLRWLFGSEGRSSIRAGFSISYLRDGFTVVSNALGVGTTNPGLIQTVANNTPTGTLTQAGIPLATPAFKMPVTDAENFQANFNNGLWTFDPNLRTPYVQQWSLGIEREISNNMALEIRYVGNHAVKIFRAIDYNEVNIFENGFLQEFLNAQTNLRINGGSSFEPGAPGTLPLPTFTTLFAGIAPTSAFRSTGFINNLNNNNIGAMVNTLAFNSVYRANRANLAPNFFVANPNAAFARLLTNGSYSNYHSIQVEMRRRLSGGLSFQGSYTFSKVLTDTDGGGQSTLEPPRTLRNFRLDRHRAGFDQTHRFIANGIYELPFGPGRPFLTGGPGVVRKLVEGWQVGTIINWQTGGPFLINSNRSTVNNFNNNLNPARLVGMSFEEFERNVGIFRTGQGVFYINPSLLNLNINPATGRLTGATLKEGILGPPAPGTFGNFPRNAINGPSFFQTDFSIIKRIRFFERADVEFRTTLSNAFNNANFIYNGEAFDDATFGQITATGVGNNPGARIIHFQLAINW